MNFNILQWNIKGLLNNYSELQMLIKQLNPFFIAIQETHCNNYFTPILPRNYLGYFHNASSNTHSKQGVAILVKDSIPHKRITINSQLQAVAIEINMCLTFTIVSIYIPPCQTFCSRDLTDIFSSINTPILVLGDFNSWSNLWGSSVVNHRGRLVENAILQSNLCVLNDGRPTHFSTHATFTHIDISLCSSSLLPLTSWQVLNDLNNSDHFPIVLKMALSSNNSPREKSHHGSFLTSLIGLISQSWLISNLSNGLPQAAPITMQRTSPKLFA